MCGIAGFCDFNNRSNETILKAMTDVIGHRGPDDHGKSVHQNSNATVGLGHRRLSILDLSPLGHQPYNFNKLSMVFNGEVYNFKEVREKLEQRGYTFVSNSDTEVIIKAYDAYGIRCVEEFIGMFAFALLDHERQKLFLVRDRAGVKPVNYYWKNDLLLFGSELKSFHQHPNFEKELDYNSVALYFTYSYIPAPYSIFKNTYKLKPGHFLEIDLATKALKEVKYWDVLEHYNKPKLKISYEEAEEHLQTLLKSACEYRMVADVPVGVFLSGGYDSTAVASILQAGRTEKLKTFTIGFEVDQYNEAPFAKKIAEHLGTDHTEHYCTYKEAYDIIPTLPDIYDEPFGDNSIIPTTLVSKVAIQKVKVALSADGGDEIFAGYPKFGMSLNYTRKFPFWVQTALSSGMSLINPEHIPVPDSAFNFATRYHKMQLIWKRHDPVQAMKVISQFNTETELRARMKYPFSLPRTDFDINGELNKNNDDLNRMLAVDYRTFLVDNNLNKVDRATMSVSLEGREPLLDHRIIEFVAQLPSQYKFQPGKTKIILKNIVHKYVPRPVMERPKMGFIVPIMDWFRNELKDLMMEYLDENLLKQQDIFNAGEVIKLRDRYLNGRPENVQKLWHLLVFQMWYKRWLSASR